uniref:Crocetin glucosyltransferase 3 n=1 Tax=Crocus sativus TaxID=82528 RepID=GLT3_CROSA|nr:RecName: Full=Crocetin glucosyltransferase 3 [Crocus sativus]AAQ56280.1 glucosyltransferase-like protein [Crocus sativus]
MAKEHIVLFPFMSQGHIIPFLSLAKLISERHPTYTITLLNTPLNILNLQSTLPPNSNIHLKSLPYRSSDFGLPPDRENTDSLPFPLVLSFYQSGESLATHFTHFVSDLTRQNHDTPPLLIVADVFFGWTAEIAKRLNTHVSFSTCGAYGTAAYFSVWLHLPHAETDLPDFTAPGFPETFKLQRNQLSTYLKKADGSDRWSKFFQRQISLSLTSDAMICNTVEEMEAEGLRLLRKNTGLRVWSIGPLLPSLPPNSSLGRSGRKSGMEVSYIMKWLDSHPPGSVVYVSFGSIHDTAAQMTSLAVGLAVELATRSCGHSGRRFGGNRNRNSNPNGVPDEFEARMRGSGRGILIHGWAPQLEILEHESTGAFVSHCGWNSTLESLSRGVCMIGWPLAAEQFYNSKMVEEDWEWGGTCEGSGGGVRSEEVERLVRLVTEDEKGSDEENEQYDEMIGGYEEKGGEGSLSGQLIKFIGMESQ